MNSIKIIGAVYGAHGEAIKCFDVTSKVQELVVQRGDSLRIGNETFGDPCNGQTKHFGAVYSVGGEISAVACEEGQEVTFK